MGHPEHEQCIGETQLPIYLQKKFCLTLVLMVRHLGGSSSGPVLKEGVEEDADVDANVVVAGV